MMSNPDMMTDMMKKNLGGIVPQVPLLRHMFLTTMNYIIILNNPAH